jgi:ferrochelatase
MTYGQPSVASALATLEAEGIDRIIAFPMYPQYASTTTASVYDAVYRAAAGQRHERKRYVPALRFVPPYYDHPGYIEALRATISAALAGWEHTPDRLVFSFHGNPQRYTDTGDPYRDQVEATVERLAAALGLAPADYMLTFQSRFGPEPWLQPYTDETLEALAEAGARHVAVACPGFTADCLETLDEIGNEGAEAFEAAGGAHLLAIPCLNDHPLWLDAMADIVQREAAGWVDPMTGSDESNRMLIQNRI